MTGLKDFFKTKEYLLCVDSDGCAMDTMDIKHFQCFGPCMVEEWGLNQWKDEILKRWNEINLYSMTRGINRFKGLAMALKEINDKYCPIDGIEILTDWAEHARELSNGALEQELEKQEVACFRKALNWSIHVNKKIGEIPDEEKKPFEGVKEALEYAHDFCDVAIVSSANLSAVLEEWEMYGLLPLTDIVLAQDAGSKAYCISELLKKGYEKHKVLMAGDAPGDLQAAQSNEVGFYPILVKHEGKSWKRFPEALDKVLEHRYQGEYQELLMEEFLKNLSGE